MYAAGLWIDLPKKPPLHQQVLVQLKAMSGDVCDVACYAGEYQLPEGGKEERWILADVRLESKQIKRWAFIRVPDEIPTDPASEI